MGQVIRFPVDRLALLREDIVACVRSAADGRSTTADVEGANCIASWLLRPGGAIERLTANQPEGAA